MEDLVKLGREFVEAMRHRQGFSNVDEIYAENAESVEAVVPPGRDVRIAKGRVAIRGKREDWAATHEIHTLNADGPYIHPPNRFGVRFEAEVTQKATGQQMTLRELALYTIDNGKIIREEFFMFPR
ncbi:nuclear transport factor 2 family protein [Ruegeria sp. HKCCD8929]|uniref:nuclear transport factor 2 family protein n=1 Tax=Ruegeria sp. HKCCD8929 TaxID=2683006 RepID=UPI0014881A69|nr:nuclear transport factor 2 family protein [Ruegeria sp. HKCCD8929]